LEEETPTHAVEIDLFTHTKPQLHIAIPLTDIELSELLQRLGPVEPPLASLQVPHMCAELPSDILLFKAFPAMVVEVVWKRVHEGDDAGAVALCDYDLWRFGLA
jgi:hypothetical protein